MARNSVDTRHGLSTRYAGVMENSRGKSRRDETAHFRIQCVEEPQGEEGKGMVNESRESAIAQNDSPFARLIPPAESNALTSISDIYTRLSMN